MNGAEAAQAALLAHTESSDNQGWLVRLRRDLHRFPEPGWQEYRTASTVVSVLRDLGYEVRYGRAVVAEEARLGVPAAGELAAAMERAMKHGAPPGLVQEMAGGFTGVVATLRLGEGPVVALRFDMDAVELQEASEPGHRPHVEGFASSNAGIAHGCGHDGHTAIGLGVARALAAMKPTLARGTIRLIFQPAEEGMRGAVSMVEKGVVDDADFFLAAHIGEGDLALGDIVAAASEFQSTDKFDAEFRGRSAHAGGNPENGRNALLAAATAALQLHAISRHSRGRSFVNVGYMRAGGSRNVIPAEALLKLETRGDSDIINEFVAAEAQRVLEAAARMYDVSVTIRKCGKGIEGRSDAALSALVREVARTLPRVAHVRETHPLGGAEDAAFFMRRVHEHGGQAAYLLLGAGASSGHHTSIYDFDEAVLTTGVQLFGATVARLLSNGATPARSQAMLAG